MCCPSVAILAHLVQLDCFPSGVGSVSCVVDDIGSVSCVVDVIDAFRCLPLADCLSQSWRCIVPSCLVRRVGESVWGGHY